MTGRKESAKRAKEKEKREKKVQFLSLVMPIFKQDNLSVLTERTVIKRVLYLNK